ncbi:hypothetical protein BGX26_009493 [Mortierella sp. AD094]|nr:hypothetical protein BGX26_009493 [Mortierella sp. AD094]
MTAAENGTMGPIELQGPQQKLHESQGEPSQMNIDPEEQASHVSGPQHKPLKQQHDPPGYQPRDTTLEEAAARKNSGAGPTDYRHSDKQSGVDEHIEEFYDDDTSSEADLRQVNIADWAESSGNASDAVVQSSDDYGNDMDDIRDDDDDDEEEEEDIEDEDEEDDIEDDEDNISDDTGDTDELQEIRGKSDYHYNRHIHHGPYLKSRRQVEQLRKSQGRPGALRKRPLKLRTISSTGVHLETTASSGAAIVADQSAASNFASSQLEFTKTCEGLSRMLQQANAMFEQGDLEIYKRNPKRPSRLAHVERMARFDEYPSEYGPEDDEVPQLQQDFQRLFFALGGLEICMSAIEFHMGSAEYPDVKLRNLLLLLSLISRIPVAGDFGHSQFSKLSEFSKRLITAVLGYFPDNADNFRSVSKATVLDIISLVGYFLLENYRMQTMHLNSGEEPDADYGEFSLHDPISRSNLGEVKFADFRLEMAVRLMKTSRLDLRLAGLVELKEVLVRIQRLQQGRSRLRRRSEVDMDLQMDLDRKPIEHLCSKLQTMQIVECIFGSNIHLEIVQRSTDVLVFMVQARVLTVDDIELIWAAVGEEGPISLIPYETLLNVLRNSTPSFNTRDDPSFGVTPPSNRDVISGIAHLLKEGLGFGPLPQDLSKLIDCCTKDLKTNHPGAIWSLQVVQHIFENHFMSNDSGATQFYKQTCSSLSELYISDLKAYTSAVKSFPPTPSPTVSSFASLSVHHLSHEYWRSLQLKMRFEFLKTMARLFPVYWNSPNLAETLWGCFIVDPIGVQEQDEAFQCLEAMTEAHFVQYIYEKLLPGLDIATITQKAWQCVRQYFLLLNWHRGYLMATEDPSIDGAQVIVVLSPLYGMDLIWKIALHAQQPIVGAHAIELLSTLIKKQNGQKENGARDAAYSFREGLVETCVEHLVKSSDHLSNDDTMDMPDVSLVFERCIGILKAFLVACNSERDESASRPEMHGTLDEDAMLTIKVNSTIPLFQVSVHPAGTLGSLRKAIAAKLSCAEPEDVRLFSLGKDFLSGWDSRTLEELQIENGQTFLASRRFHQATPIRTVEVAKRVPTDLLLEPGFFERVRKIFLLNEKYASQAWEVVTRLPTSPVLLHSLATLQEDVDWATVLDARSPFLLLYSLQIVNSLIKRDQANEDPAKQLWVKRFLLLGGQQHLTTLLMSDSGLGAVDSSPTARKALGLMLRVLVRLTGSSEIESSMATGSNGLTVPAFLDRLVSEILTSASREGGHSSNDQGIVLNATSLISYLCAGPSGWQYFHAGPDIRALIFVSMVQSDSMQIRQTVLEMGRKFCLQMEAVNYCSEDYFKTLYTRLMETIINHPSSEDMSLLKEDTVLVGMLKVATAMINTDQKLKQLDIGFRIIDYIFDECLFPQTSGVQNSETSSAPGGAKCKSEGSRSAAFSFLEESARGETEILRHVIVKTRKHFEREFEIEDQWGYDPQTIKRASCGFVGLQNLGATCYVNSIIQQFFMNKDFRSGILDAPVSEDDPGKHDTLLFQLQALFGNLQESIRRAYNAHGFCYAYKDWDGNPMNVAVQMDVDEFFNILFDRLENSVKSTPQEELFKQQYGGKLVQQIKSKDCEHISEREDSFFSIQCEVKNKKTLEESLQLYVQGEILDGDNKYKCSSCDKHVDAIKRACIKELPQNLILHLKRFDYDMDTMRRIKINDRFEFPTSLDMEPYTLDYLTRKEQAQDAVAAASSPTTHLAGGQENTAAFQYNLVGVLVHTGTADSGHYYSYIKDRNAVATSSSHTQFADGDSSHWYLFNDSKVEGFDASDIPAKAFGGPEFIPVDSSPYMKSPTRSITKPYSAYMLFYERAERPEPGPQSVLSGDVPSDIRELVVKENTALLKDLSVFDRLYYRFVWDLFNLFRTSPQQIENNESGELSVDPLDYLSMQYGLDFFFSVLIHARDVDQELQQWTHFLSSLLMQYPKGCVKFLSSLASNRTLLLRVLLLCPITQVREAVIDLIYEALHGLREQDKVEYGLVASMAIEATALSLESGEDELWTCSQGSPIHGLIQALLQVLPEARANWRNFDEYFKLIYNITQLGRAERVMMVREGYISELIEFYISDERGDSKKKKMGDKFTKPSFRYLLLTVQEVLATCDISRSYETLQRRGIEQSGAHGSITGRGYRKPSSSSSSTSSAVSSSNSDDAALESDTHIPSASPEVEQAVLLSQADFNALFACYSSPGHSDKSQSLILISKMIQERIDSTIIARLVTHLSTHDIIGHRLLESLASYLQYANEDQVSTIMHIFKELVLVVDEHLESRVEFILVQLAKVLEHSPQPQTAYDCLDFFRTICDYGQCGRFAQAWLLRNSRVWLQELMLNQNDADTRMRARLFYMELLSSERAFNEWNDEQAANASVRHFGRLLELMSSFPDMLSYYPMHLRRDDDSGSFRFVDYFRALTELVKSDAERQMFFPSWKLFIDILTKIDGQQLTLDYDKKEMMVFWSKVMYDNQEANIRLSNFKPLGILLRKFFVCLQINPANVQFHREILPIYFGLVLRFCKLNQAFHVEWAQCHNYTWAIGSMKWGAFTQHCPDELKQLLQFTLLELPQYRQECWRMLPTPETQRFLSKFMQMARDTFESENELAGKLFYQHRGLVHLTEALNSSGTATSDDEFFAVEALTLLYDYLCEMVVCRNTQEFAEAIDHWSNIHTAIELLAGNLMWTAPPQVYARSIKILEVIAKEATYSQAEPILIVLDKVHLELRDTLESDSMNQAQVQTMFGGSNSPYCQYGVFEAREALSSVSSPPMRIGPLIFMHPELFGGLGNEAAQQVLRKWFVPYWELARLACNLDGGRDGHSKAIELAALMTIEQISAGSIIHLDVLCKEAATAVDNEDTMLLLQNPYVALCIEHLLKRENYVEALTKSRLNACTVLLKSTCLGDSQLMELAEENFVRAEQILEHQILAKSTSSNEPQVDELPKELSSTEENARALIISIQNLTILGIDSQDAKEMDAARLKRLHERLCLVLSQLPDKYRSALLDISPRISMSAQGALGSVKADATEEAGELPIGQKSSADESVPSPIVEDETVMMTGIIQAPAVNAQTGDPAGSSYEGNGEKNE